MAKETKVTLKNTGLCSIYMFDQRILPTEEIEVDSSVLELVAVVSLIGKGELTVKNNYDLNEQIKEKSAKSRKKPAKEKTRAELEDGGVF